MSGFSLKDIAPTLEIPDKIYLYFCRVVLSQGTMPMETEKRSTSHRRVLVTGGAGFIGSHLVDALMTEEAKVCVVDNLSNGRLENIGRWLDHPGFKFVNGDLLNEEDITGATEDCEVIFHLAANPEVRLSSVEPSILFEQNVIATYNLLEALRKSDGARTLVFTSSSTVYGDAQKIPTPEDYAPLEPISVYGASKLASEALITAYARTYGFGAIIHRLANIIGPRSRHGVIYDFIWKLNEISRELEILGDGTQAKSYLHIDDCVEAMLFSLEKSSRQVEVFNLGSEDWTDVKTIAGIVVEEMGLKDVTFRFTGGVDGGRGWKGDIKYMLLDIAKLKSIGWKPKSNSTQAVRAATRSILEEFS
jgi:UDP-glucose 4-epimerase